MNNQMNDRKAEINRGMIDLILLIAQWKKGNSALYDPKDQKAANNKGHALYGMPFQRLKIIDQVVPHRN